MALDEVDKLEQMVKAKSIPLSENASYEWYDWLITPIPESMKKSASNVKENNHRAFQNKIRLQHIQRSQTKKDCRHL